MGTIAGLKSEFRIRALVGRYVGRRCGDHRPTSSWGYIGCSIVGATYYGARSAAGSDFGE